MRRSGYYTLDTSTIVTTGDHKFVIASIPVTTDDLTEGNTLRVFGTLSYVDESAGVPDTSAETGGLSIVGFTLSELTGAQDCFGLWLLDTKEFAFSYSAICGTRFDFSGPIVPAGPLPKWDVTARFVGVGTVTDFGATRSYVTPLRIDPDQLLSVVDSNQNFNLVLEVCGVTTADLVGFIRVAYDFELQVIEP